MGFMALQLRIIPTPVPCGRYGTWQYDLELYNGTPAPVTLTAVRWQLYRRDGELADAGSRDPALCFGRATVPAGSRARGRAATWSHWEEPFVVWAVATNPPAATAGGRPVATARADLQPAPEVPFAYAAGREAVLARPEGSGPHPALLILHPFGGSARAMAWAAQEAARNGFVGMAISQPGFGGSAGPRDNVGPESQHAALAALDYLSAQAAVIPSCIGIWGISRGALLGGLVAARSPRVAAAALQAGPYDLPLQRAVMPAAHWDPGTRFTPEEVAERNLLAQAEGLTCPVLLLHGGRDEIAPVAHAERLAARLRDLGRPVELALFPSHGHGLPPARVWPQHLVPFFRRHLGGA